MTCAKAQARRAGAAGSTGGSLAPGVSRVTDSVTNVDGLRNAIAKLCGQDRLRAVLRELFE
jgi:hypothetical protein